MQKKYFISIIVALSLSFSYSQTDTIINGVKYNVVSRYMNGQIKEFGNYLPKRKIKHGEWIINDKVGHLIEKGVYKNGKKEGYWTERGDDNLCCWSGNYKKGKKHGKWFDASNRFIIYKKGKKMDAQIVEWKQ